jgi:hypothetical protein
MCYCRRCRRRGSTSSICDRYMILITSIDCERAYRERGHYPGRCYTSPLRFPRRFRTIQSNYTDFCPRILTEHSELYPRRPLYRKNFSQISRTRGHEGIDRRTRRARPSGRSDARIGKHVNNRIEDHDVKEHRGGIDES